MSMTPDPDDFLDEVRACITEVYTIISPTKNKSNTATVSRAGVDYWTTYISDFHLAADEYGGQHATGDCTIRCVYNGSAVTSANSTAEKTAQSVMVKATVAFLQRPRLQSAAYPNGVTALDMSGVVDVRGEIVVSEGDKKSIFTAVITLTLPLLFQFDTIEY